MPNFSEDPDAFPSDPSQVVHRVSTTTAPRAQKRMLAQAEQAVNDYQQQVAQAMEEQRAQNALMNEARIRFAKASLYQQILEGVVFEGNDSITLEVNAEFREFAQQKLCALLGIESESDKKRPKLTDEQIEVLSMVANGFLAKVGAVSSEKISSAPQKVGKLATVRRQAPVPPPPPPRQHPVQRPSPQEPEPQQLTLPLSDPSSSSNVQELSRPDGTTFKTNLGISQVVPPRGSTSSGPKPVPMPSPDEQVAIAAMQGERAAAGSNLVARIIAVNSQNQG